MLKHFKAKLDSANLVGYDFISQTNMGGGVLTEPSKLNQTTRQS